MTVGGSTKPCFPESNCPVLAESQNSVFMTHAVNFSLSFFWPSPPQGGRCPSAHTGADEGAWGIICMIGFRPAGRVPFAAMQKEPKNRWGTARGASGCALRPNGLTPRPHYGGPAALRWMCFAKSDTAHPACLAQKFSPLLRGILIFPPR